MSSLLPRRRFLLIVRRTFLSGARVPWVRDRALDHAVEKEKLLLPYHSLKNHLISQSSASSSSSSSSSPVPLSSIIPVPVPLPFRPLRFLRRFPSSFLESFPPESPLHPHFSPSPSLLDLHSRELSLYSSSTLSDAADRLLRLLMLSPSRSLPLPLLHSLRWDLGLPLDFPLSLLPLYPDYFHLSHAPNNNNNTVLELVCYTHRLAVSQMESYAAKTGGYTKGMPLAFPLSYPRGFEMEKKVRRWVEDWQKLPYVSPYEDGSKLPKKSEVWEKWVVGVVHEFLSLCIGRKTEKGNLEMVAPHLGLPSAIAKVIKNYPGIFYVSNKLRTRTVVLREAYRRDLLVEKHPLMGMRYQYIHLMREGRKEERGNGKNKKKKSKKSRRGDGENIGIGEYGDLDEEEEDDDDEKDYVEGDENEEGSDFDSEDEESDDDEEEEEDLEDDDYEDSRQKRVREGPQGIQFENMERTRQGINTRRDEMHGKNNVGGRLHGRGNYEMGRNDNIGRRQHGRRNSEMQGDNKFGRKPYERGNSETHKNNGGGGRPHGRGYSPRGNPRVNSWNRVST